MHRKEVEIAFDGLTASITTTEPVTLFRILKALKNEGRQPKIRYHDDEIDGKTCWQPM